MGKKGTLSEVEMGQILRRYSAVTVMGLLREIAKCESTKLDFNALVKKSCTGISCAREYQALWRHIAYREELDDSYEEDAEPLDDDSDLEFELEPKPSVTAEATAEAAAWVKADMQRYGILPLKRKADALSKSKTKDADATPAGANQAPASSGLSASAVDANGKTVPAASVAALDVKTTNLTGTASQVASVAADTTPGGNLQSTLNQSERKKRKLWTPDEDQELIAAVEKCGEGNWTTILKGAFTHDRTAAQLSQRWALIKKRREIHALAGFKSASPSIAAEAHQSANHRATSASGASVAQNGGTSLASSAAQLASSVSPTSGAAPAVTPSPPVAGTTTGPSTSAQAQVQVQASGSSSSSPGSLPITTAPAVASSSPSVGVDASVAKPGSQAVARPPAGSVMRTTAVATNRQSQTVGAARSTAGSSTSVVGTLPADQARNGSAKTVANGVSTGRLIAPGAVVMSAAAAQAASVGGSEMWQATTLPPTSAQTSLPVKYGGRGNLGASGGRVNVITKQPVTGPDPGVQAAAVAAGARIAPASAAASLLKAAQSGNVVHIGPGGVPITKTGLPNQTGIGHGSNAGSRVSSGGAIVHYIRTGAGAPSPAFPGMMRPAQQPKTQSAKPVGVNQGASNAVPKAQSSPAPSGTPTQSVTPPSSQSK
ncbi:hypothetical protein R1sor_017754 [Riccia sorocarpa]|uniref:Uncharacterized protein n=1 Tax=Riccia sorocarpa TaxID=122646 RepID=A0ABD3IBS8_9MARC